MRHVKLSLLNSADYQEYPDRKVGPRPALQALLSAGSDLVNLSIQKVRHFDVPAPKGHN